MDNKENYLNIIVDECPNLPSSDEEKVSVVPKKVPLMQSHTFFPQLEIVNERFEGKRPSKP